MDALKTAKRVFLMKFDSNPYEARQQLTSLSRADAIRQLIASLSDWELSALVSVKMESETEPDRKAQ